MKSVCVSLLIYLAMTGCCFAQSIIEKLNKPGEESTQALKTVLESSQNYDARVLYVAASVAFKKSRIEDAAFLFYIARFRVTVDRELFPPAGTGRDSPLVEMNAFQQTLGSAINPGIMKLPTEFASALNRVKTWKPVVDAKYAPGWEWKTRGDEGKAFAAMETRRKSFLAKMEGYAKLLSDKDYHKAFMHIQSSNLSDKPSSEASIEEAMEVMRRIENENGIQGFAADLDKVKM